MDVLRNHQFIMFTVSKQSHKLLCSLVNSARLMFCEIINLFCLKNSKQGHKLLCSLLILKDGCFAKSPIYSVSKFQSTSCCVLC